MTAGSMMLGSYDPGFVALSIFIAVLSAYAALDLAVLTALDKVCREQVVS